MMTIDMTAELATLITGTLVLLVVAALAVVTAAFSSGTTWSTSASQVATPQVPNLAIVDAAPSAPAHAGEAPSDSSVPEAA